MENIEKLNNLLTSTQTLANLLTERKNTNEYTISFFSQAFETAHHLLIELHALEAEQMELFSKQLEAHQSILSSLSTNIQTEVLPKQEMPLPKVMLPIEATTERQKEVELEVIKTVEIIKTLEVTEIVAVTEPVKITELAFDNFVDNFVDKPIHNFVNKEVSSPVDKSIDESVNNSVDKVVNKSNRCDFTKAFTLNDRFFFRRELFKGDDALMNITIEHLNQIETLNESITYLHSEFSFDFESQSVKSFVVLLEKRFS